MNKMTKVTTEDLIASIAADRPALETFEARAEYAKRTRSDWRAFAPVTWRTRVEGVEWWNFVEEGA